MATYKIIQDIETEDKLLGPLTLRQFIYAGITVLCGYLSFVSISKHLYPLLIIFLPVMAGTGFFAFPWSSAQSTETWALAKIRFMFKPHRRIWNQSGMKDLVTITAPKKIERNLTKNLSQAEVKSRLKILADTIDSRGWSTKNVNLNMYTHPAAVQLSEADSERLVDVTALPQSVPSVDIHPADDMLDEKASATAQNLNQMIDASNKARREQIAEEMQEAAIAAENAKQAVAAQKTQQAIAPQQRATQPQTQVRHKTEQPKQQWFVNNPGGIPKPNAQPGYVTFNSQVIAPYAKNSKPTAKVAPPTAEERALAAKLKAQSHKPDVAYGHLKTIRPMYEQFALAARSERATPIVPKAVVKNLATQYASNKDLNVSSLSRQINNDVNKKSQELQNEVVINLH